MNNRQLQIIFAIILFVILEISGITLYSSNQSTIDFSKIEVRQPDSSFVSSYSSQKEFIYSQPAIKTNFFKQLFTYLQKRLGALSRITAALPWIMKALIGLLILFSVFVVIKQSNLHKLFYSEKEIKSPEFRISAVSNQLIYYDNEIKTQLNQKQFRKAIRLLYLKVFQQLQVKDIIKYSKDKTNVDYLRDLSNTDIKPFFYNVTQIYNYVWYGELEISEEQFLNFEKSFQSIFIRINAEK